MTIDWTKPIEAVHLSGDILSIFAVRPHGNQFWHHTGLIGSPPATEIIYLNDTECCKHSADDMLGWKVRNVQSDTVPVDRALWERCVFLVSDMAQSENRLMASMETKNFYNRAIDLAKLLPVEVDPDEAEAMAFATSRNWNYGDGIDNSMVRYALAAIKLGRELERGGK